MSFFSSLSHFMSCRFGLTRPEPSDNILIKETEYLKNKWDAEFIHDNKHYIHNDYRNFIDNVYPAFITDHKYTFVDGNTFPATDRPKYALALSGGGIRSAAFGIGVIQALNNADLTNAYDIKDESKKPTIFSKLVYLSTVSGGGYAGAALSWCMKKWNVYPFGEIKSFCGSKAERPEDKSIDFVGCYTDSIASLFKSEKKPNNNLSSGNQPQDVDSEPAHTPKISSNRILSYIRLHGKYLSPPELPLSSLIGSAINSVFHSFIAYTFLLSTFIFSLIYIANTIFPQDIHHYSNYISSFYADTATAIKEIINIDSSSTASEDPKTTYRLAFAIFFLCLTLAGLALFLITSFSYGICSYFTGIFSDSYQLRVRAQKTLGFLVKLIFVSIVFMAIPLQIEYFKTTFIPQVLMGPGGIGAGLSALFMAVNEFRKQLQSSTETNTRFGNLVRDAIVILFIYVLLTLSYLTGELGYLNFRENWFIVFYLIPALALCFIVNINNISPHRMYRDRLMDTFLTDPTKDTYDSLAKKGRLANEFRLAELDETNHWAPYHLINTNIILNNSRNSQHNSRLGDSFVLSPMYCGSDATGYVPTKKFAFGTMTLATATSISGAAANPHSGVGGIGTSTTPLVSFLMTFFGLRLGYWVNNPKHVLSRFKLFFKPNYFIPGSFSLLNFGHTENSSYIELTDGGHFDNTGIYELIRRRIPWIILSDGSADIKATFEDLGNALSRIRIDFGVTIRFNDPKFDLCGLIPGSQAETIFDIKFNLSARGYAIGDIVYPETPDSPAFIGTFVYIKAAMTRDLPGDIYAYQADHPEFPNEPTSDQFFNERQFEAYRELGYQLTKQLMQNETAMKRLP